MIAMTVDELKQAITNAAKDVERHIPSGTPAERANCFVATLAGRINGNNDLELARAVWAVYGEKYPLARSLCTPSLMGRV